MRIGPRAATERPMDEFLEKMSEKVGIDKDTAKRVVEFLQEHADEALPLIQKSGVLDRLPGGLGDKIGKLF
jgi:hypothetical protein